MIELLPDVPPSPPAGAAKPAAFAHLLGRALTARQAAMWALKQAGRTRPEIARELGVSVPVVSKTLTRCRAKLGCPGVKGLSNEARERSKRNRGSEHRRPEVAAAAIEAASDPTSPTRKAAIERVNRELAAAGVPERVSAAVVRRMLVRYGGVVAAKRQITTAEILRTIDEELDLISTYIDDKVVAEANLRDLALAKAALIEKRALLRGEPTQIVSDHERKKLHELLPLMIEEARRRGLTIPGTVTEKVVEPA